MLTGAARLTLLSFAALAGIACHDRQSSVLPSLLNVLSGVSVSLCRDCHACAPAEPVLVTSNKRGIDFGGAPVDI